VQNATTTARARSLSPVPVDDGGFRRAPRGNGTGRRRPTHRENVQEEWVNDAVTNAGTTARRERL